MDLERIATMIVVGVLAAGWGLIKSYARRAAKAETKLRLIKQDEQLSTLEEQVEKDAAATKAAKEAYENSDN